VHVSPRASTGAAPLELVAERHRLSLDSAGAALSEPECSEQEVEPRTTLRGPFSGAELSTIGR